MSPRDPTSTLLGLARLWIAERGHAAPAVPAPLEGRACDLGLVVLGLGAPGLSIPELAPLSGVAGPTPRIGWRRGPGRSMLGAWTATSTPRSPGRCSTPGG